MSEINEYLKEAEIAVLAPAPNMLADTLTKVLADTVVFYFKAHSFHWNVTGSNFPQYHEFLGNVYEQVYGNVDRLAEEIRAEARHLEAPLLAEDPPREPPAPGGRRGGEEGNDREHGPLGCEGRTAGRDPVHAGTRAAAGLHGRPLRGRSRGDARSDQKARRRGEKNQPAPARRSCHRPLGTGRFFRHAERLPRECRPRIRAQQGTL